MFSVEIDALGIDSHEEVGIKERPSRSDTSQRPEVGWETEQSGSRERLVTHSVLSLASVSPQQSQDGV